MLSICIAAKGVGYVPHVTLCLIVLYYVFMTAMMTYLVGDHCTLFKFFPSESDVDKDPEIDENIIGEY